MEVENRFIATKHFIDGLPSESDFQLKSSTLVLAVAEGSKDVITKNLFVSVDPYQANRMKSFSSSQKAAPFTQRQEPGLRVAAVGVGRVVASGDPSFQKDDLVVGRLGWEDYTLVSEPSKLSKINLDDLPFPLSYHLSIFAGLGAFTAYIGFFNVCNPKHGDKVFISAASGSVGNVVGQYAKLFGCYVVGCAGSKLKVDLLREKLGFDYAFNYKEEPDLKLALQRYFPDGIDIYFDNVGGKMLEAAIANMKNFGRVAVCGAISEYTDDNQRAVVDMVDVIYKRITIRGFLVADHAESHAEFISTICDHLRHGRMQVLEDINLGLENLPSAFAGLFRGDNVGKKMVQLDI